MNKPDPLASRIVSLIDKHAAPVSPGRRESGTPDTLVKRLGVPDTEHVNALLQSGRLKSIGPVHKNDPEGPQRYESDHLNDVKREVLASIAEQVIEDYDGEPDDLPAAISAALASYLKSLNDGTAAKGFAAVTPRRVAFAYDPNAEERPGLLRRVGQVAGVAALAGAAYGGASYLRGRKIGAKGFLPALKAGNAANVASIRNAGSRVAGFLTGRPAAVGFSSKLPAHVTPAYARDVLRRLGVELRRANLR